VLLGLSAFDDTEKLPLPVTFPLTKSAIEGTLVQQASYLRSNSSLFEVNEQNINLFAQQLFWAGAKHKALLVWELNSQLFPPSDNAYHKLKDVCEDKRLAAKNVIVCHKHTESEFDTNEEISKGTLIKSITIISPERYTPLTQSYLLERFCHGYPLLQIVVPPVSKG
jgi:hypothetical protein